MTTKKITKKQALEMCRDLWKWMEKKKHKSARVKDDWPGWKKYLPCQHDCPICQYMAEQNKQEYCHGNCILKGIFGTGQHGCEFNTQSPYKSFIMGDGTPADAKKIWQECERLLKLMKQHKKAI